ncbi:MAG TPA: hypothetical protein VLZ76_09705 [Lysobacter sp.]|nr:hypothetical protein [Lysobacter sp.]
MRRAPALLLFGLFLCGLAGVGAAQDSVVIYRCTAADGTVSVQNDVPCPKDSQQQRRVIETVPPPSQPYVPPPPRAIEVIPVVPASAPAGPEKSTAGDAESDNAPIKLLPPPPLFACRTWSRDDYLSDDPTPAERCAPLRTIGVDGDPARGSGAACEKVRDTCTAVPEPQLCERWRQHLRDTQAMLLFGRAEDPATTRVELERIEAVIRASDCGPQQAAE